MTTKKTLRHYRELIRKKNKNSLNESVSFKTRIEPAFEINMMPSQYQVEDSFKIKDTLNPQMFPDGNNFDQEVRERILTLANDFHDSLEIDIVLEDVVVTGSIVAYTWHNQSDIDAHLMVECPSGVDRELLRDYFYYKKLSWNIDHDIFLKGYEVELYIQFLDEPEESKGRYSLIQNKWLKIPSRDSMGEPDLVQANKKADITRRQIKNISNLFYNGNSEEALKYAEYLSAKLKRMRQEGLEEEGEISSENIAYKMLRASGDLDLLRTLKNKSYDNMFYMN